MPVYYKALIKNGYELEPSPIRCGGEGSIFLVQGNSSIAAKVYSHGNAPKEKLYQMLKMPLAQKSDYIAWPQDILFNQTGTPAGFIMKRFSYTKSLAEMLSDTLNDNLFEKVRERFDAIIEELRVNLPLQEHQLGILLELLLMELFRNRPECFFNWQSTQDMTTIFHIQRYVARNFNQELTLAALADLFHVSPYWLSRSFRIITGSGFQQYLILCRLNEAKRLLLSTDLPITMVADYSGYRDVNNFIRAFRMHEKVTPLKFRKNGGA